MKLLIPVSWKLKKSIWPAAFLRRAAETVHTDLRPSEVREVARELGVSERTLRRHCMDVFGYGFKTLQRILRFQRLFRLVERSGRPKLAELALEAGFSDQAHMSREVRRLSHLAPTQLVAEILR